MKKKKKKKKKKNRIFLGGRGGGGRLLRPIWIRHWLKRGGGGESGGGGGPLCSQQKMTTKHSGKMREEFGHNSGGNSDKKVIPQAKFTKNKETAENIRASSVEKKGKLIVFLYQYNYLKTILKNLPDF